MLFCDEMPLANDAMGCCARILCNFYYELGKYLCLLENFSSFVQTLLTVNTYYFRFVVNCKTIMKTPGCLFWFTMSLLAISDMFSLVGTNLYSVRQFNCTIRFKLTLAEGQKTNSEGILIFPLTKALFAGEDSMSVTAQCLYSLPRCCPVTDTLTHWLTFSQLIVEMFLSMATWYQLKMDQILLSINSPAHIIL